MSAPVDPRPHCHGKVCWPSKPAAIAGKAMLIRRSKGSHIAHKDRRREIAGLQPYRCQVCGDWHLGNPTYPRKRP
jgi:hypothetical protein